MKGNLLWRGLLILAILVTAAVVAYPLNEKINLGLDLALMPVWGWGPMLRTSEHLDPIGAARAVAVIRPRWASASPTAGRAWTRPSRAFCSSATTRRTTRPTRTSPTRSAPPPTSG